MSNKYTRRGQQALASPAAGIKIVPRGDGLMAYEIDSLGLPNPDRSFHATALQARGERGEITFTFAQFREPTQELQSTVNIVVPATYLIRLLDSTKTLAPEFDAKIADMAQTYDEMPLLPNDGKPPLNSITYRAQVIRIIANPEFGCAIDFFEIPVSEPMKPDIDDVIRITCSPRVVQYFMNWCRKVEGKQRST